MRFVKRTKLRPKNDTYSRGKKVFAWTPKRVYSTNCIFEYWDSESADTREWVWLDYVWETTYYGLYTCKMYRELS